ncbi:MAG TPA: GH92 family glycosyl hydrolase [Candidatus Sulfotelmatobacter sp.]|jgi:predicted alpha-1,2-mannosidase|nr:GH92 family glycosyl hydrolase [Candidatus Sulfotelmatobacter sp.]
MKIFHTTILASLLCGTTAALPSRAAPQPVDDALPMVGTSGHGHMYPGATRPFGFVQLSPDTRTQGWDACSGYHYSDTNILGFSHTHLSGTGGIDLGELLIMPVTGPLQSNSDSYTPLSDGRFKSEFSHDKEFAQPGYYRVALDTYGIEAELTASAHCGMHRYTFPASKQSHILIDLVHGLGNSPSEAYLKINSDTQISGSRSNNAWAKWKTIYFVIESSKPFKKYGMEVEGRPLPAGISGISGKQLRAHLDFKTSAGEQIILRVGLSPTSIEDAKKNLRAEIPGWDFDAVRADARAEWNENLSHISVECSNPNIRQTFYSALYHTMLTPTLYNNTDGSYRGADQADHPAPGFQDYSTFSLWDVYRADMPLMSLTEPGRVNDFVQSLLANYQQSPEHLLPLWPLANYDTGSMIGYHAVPVIYDAYQKGFRGFDTQLAYQAMRDSAMSDRCRGDEYRKLGYIPWHKPPYPRGSGATVARTLECSYDDWCIAQMAAALGKTNDAELFTQRSEYFKNVFDPQTKFFRAKNADGTFVEPFDPLEVAHNTNATEGSFTEADAWQYAFAVQHDVPGMIQLYGGNAAFVQRLDEFFNMDSAMHDWRIDVTGLVGQYAHGNEPCHHIAYLYALAGAQYQTARRVREIMLTQYDNTPEGLCGNDDCGQISAWYVWSALGLYPVNPANGVYVIGSPMVQKAVIKLDPKYSSGGTFTITVHSKPNGYMQFNPLCVYVQSAKLNGQPLTHPWITHEDIMRGGTLDFEMDLLPNKSWGNGN